MQNTLYLTILAIAVFSVAAGEPHKPQPATEALNAKLDERVALNFDRATPQEILDRLMELTTIKWDLVGTEKTRIAHYFKVKMKDARVRDVLDMLCDQSEWRYEFDGNIARVIWIHHGEVVELQIYDVSGLTSPAGGGAGFEITSPTLTNVADMIRNRVRPDEWDQALGTSIEERGGKLIVMQSAHVHREIKDLLGHFRNAQKPQLQIDSRAIEIKSIDLDKIRLEADERKIPPSEFDDATIARIDALVASAAATELFKASGTAPNGGQIMLYDCRHTLAEDEHDPAPIARSVFGGTYLSVRALLSDDALCTRTRFVAAIATDSGASDSASVLRVISKAPADKPTAMFKIELPTAAQCNLQGEVLHRTGRIFGASAPKVDRYGPAFGKEILLLLRFRLSNPVRPPATFATTTPLRSAPLKEFEPAATIKFDGVPFFIALEQLRAQTGFNMAVDLDYVPPENSRDITVELTNDPLSRGLEKLMASTGAAAVPYGSLRLITHSGAAVDSAVKLRIFDVRDLTSSFVSFDISRWTNGLRFPKAKPPAGSLMQAADLSSILKDKIFVNEFANPATSLEESCGKLVILNTEPTLARIEKYIADFRLDQFKKFNWAVRWSVVSTADLKKMLGGDTPGVLTPEQTRQCIELLGQPESYDISAARFCALSGVLMSTEGAIQRDYVSDYVPDEHGWRPRVRTACTGGMAAIEACSAQVKAEETPRIAAKVKLVLSRFDPTPVVTQEKAEPPAGTVRSPAIQRHDIQTAINIPDGGAALFCASVPEWIKEEGKDRNKRTLIVLVHGKISAP